MGRRRTPGGNFYRTETGRWRLVVTVVDEGHSYPKTFRGKTKKEAEGKRDAWCEERGIDLFAITTTYGASRRVKAEPPPATTVGDALDALLVREQLRGAADTYIAQRSSLARNQIIPRLGLLPARTVTPSMIEGLQDDLIASGLASSTVSSCRKLLNAMFQDLVRSGDVSDNPVPLTKAVPRTQKSPTVLEGPDVRALLKALENHPRKVRWMTSLTTGLRQSEVLGLCWHDVNLDEGYLLVRRQLRRQAWIHGCGVRLTARADHTPVNCPVRIRTDPYKPAPKTFAGNRKRYLHQEMVAILRAYQEHQVRLFELLGRTSDIGEQFGYPVFASPDGSPLRQRSDARDWERLMDDAGLLPQGQHSTRHTIATIMLEAGIDARLVIDQMGWSNAGMTVVYQHPGAQDLRRAADRTAEVFEMKAGRTGSPDNVVGLEDHRRS